MRFRFVHAADLHLDTPFEGLARASDEVAAALRDASLAAWDALVGLAIERDAAFVLLAGDIYDGAERGVRAQLRFLRGLERLVEHDIRALVVHGNHDPVREGWGAIRSWPEGVTVFGSEGVLAVPIERAGEVIATVHGISFAQREVHENLVLRFEGTSPRWNPGLQIGLLHCNVGGAGDHADYSPCSLDDLCRAGLDYWALGHVHKRAVLREGEPWIVYPGNLQGRSPKPSERGPKGAVVVEVEGAAVQRVEFVALDRVRFVSLELDASECVDLAELERALDEHVRALRAAHAGRGLIVRASIEGRGVCAADLRRPGSEAQMLAELRETWQGAAPFVWWESLRSHMRGALDRAELARGSDFRAELLQLADALVDDHGLERFAADQLASLPARAAKEFDGALDREALLGLLQESESLALELLEPEDPL